MENPGNFGDIIMNKIALEEIGKGTLMDKVYVIESQWWDGDANSFLIALEDNTFFTSKDKAKEECCLLNKYTIKNCMDRKDDRNERNGYSAEVLQKTIEKWTSDLELELDEGSDMAKVMQSFEYQDFHYVTELTLDKR